MESDEQNVFQKSCDIDESDETNEIATLKLIRQNSYSQIDKIRKSSPVMDTNFSPCDVNELINETLGNEERIARNTQNLEMELNERNERCTQDSTSIFYHQ